MADFTTLLEEALEAWRYVREGLIAELEVIPAAEIDFRPHPQSRSVAELARHIAESGLMMSGELSRSDGDFRRQDFESFIEEYASHAGQATDRDALLELLRDSHAQGERELLEAGELHMLQYIHRFDGEPGTRLAWLHHGIAHEMYHRGQLALYVRLTGEVPALTRLIQGS